ALPCTAPNRFRRGGRPTAIRGTPAIANCWRSGPDMPAPIKFALVGVLGFLIQLIALRCLIDFACWTWPAATVAAVECAVVHNFIWHECWTWTARLERSAWQDRAGRFARFNLANGMTSIAGNLLVMAPLVGGARIPAPAANAAAVAIVAIANFLF